MQQLSFQAERKHRVGACADRFTRQKRKRLRSSAIHVGTNPDQLLVERAAKRARKAIRICRLRGVVAGGFLRRNLDLRVAGNEVIRQGYPLHDFNSLTDKRVVFHVAHRYQPINARYSEPMQGVGHQLLETGILNPRHAFGPLKVRSGHIAPFLPLARVVDKELRHLSKRSPLLAVVHNDPESARLRHAHTFLDAVNEIGAAGTYVGPENVRSTALVVHTASNRRPWIRKFLDLAEKIDGRTSNWRQKDLQIRTRHQFREHTACLLEQRAPQGSLGGAETLRNARQVPNRIDGYLHDRNGATLVDDAIIAP